MPRTAPFALTLVVLAGFAVATTVAAAVLGNPEVASVFDNGAHGNRDARGAAVSAAGRYVAFTSTAALAGVPTARVLQLYVRDRVAGRTLLASANAAGQAADDDVDDPSAHRAYAISGDGRYAVFASRATNLVDDDRDGADMDVFRNDLVTGAVALVSRAPGGVQANGSVAGDPDVSYDGSRVVFETGSGATNLWPDDTDNASDIVMRDIAFDTNVLVSVTGAGLPASQVGGAAISADGRHVAFEAGSAVLVRDLATSSTITAASTGAAPDISGDGQVVAYEAGSVRARALGASEEIIASAGSAPSISADGRRVAFEGARPNAPFVDVYVRDRPGGATQRVSERLNGTQVDHDSTRGAISGNGAIVAFGLDDAGPGPSLAADDTNGLADVLVATLAPSDAAGPQIAVAAPADGAAVDAATVTVRGTATDPAGIVSVSAGGFPAAVGPAGDFSLEVPLNVG